MSSSIGKASKYTVGGVTGKSAGVDVETEVTRLAEQTIGGMIFDSNDDSTSTVTTDDDYQDQNQLDATNAARIAAAAAKKKKTTSTVLTSPLGTSTAKTAVTKLGGV